MHLTRRFFLQSTGVLSAYLGVAPLELLRAEGDAAIARPVTRGRTLVVIFLRGGADGLNLVVPHGDPAYYQLRRTLAVPAPRRGPDSVVSLDGFFGLHPRLAPLLPHFLSGNAVATHAVGYDQNTRSHFEEQDVWETGVIGNTVNSDGWLNRHLATSTGHGSIRALAVGDTLPRILQGRAPSFALRGLEDLTLPRDGALAPETVAAALEHAYCTPPPAHRTAARDLLAQSGAVTLDGMARVRDLLAKSAPSTVEFPDTRLGRQLQQVAQLIKADVGLEVAEVDYGGWDTHQNQGGGAGGMFGELVGQMADALAAFMADLESRLDDVLVVTLTDFGRTAAENGTGGTDHGWANAMLVLGGGVKRAQTSHPDGERPVIANWPGLAPDQLHEGRDLLHTIDFRDVLGELVRVHLGNPNLTAVLPGHEFKPVGLVG
ncbi:MAG: DUF1501 domain-containing protein [Phycisphaerales bacterium]|nr:DUF1501 domain-containing protein [Phycisphaerales bacterium]